MNILKAWKEAETVEAELAVIEAAFESEDGFGDIAGVDKANPFDEGYAEAIGIEYVVTLSDGSILAHFGGDTTAGCQYAIYDRDSEHYQEWLSKREADED
jgi:hypothetical protein